MIAVEEVFDDWNAAIMRSLRRRFSGTPEATLEDGAAFAWAQFAAKRPPDDYALAWLKLVARREVLALIRRWERPVEGRREDGRSSSEQARSGRRHVAQANPPSGSTRGKSQRSVRRHALSGLRASAPSM